MFLFDLTNIKHLLNNNKYFLLFENILLNKVDFFATTDGLRGPWAATQEPAPGTPQSVPGAVPQRHPNRCRDLHCS